MSVPDEQIAALADNALDAFWEVVRTNFPKATTGDLSPLQTFALNDAAERAIAEWIANNNP